MLSPPSLRVILGVKHRRKRETESINLCILISFPMKTISTALQFSKNVSHFTLNCPVEIILLNVNV